MSAAARAAVAGASSDIRARVARSSRAGGDGTKVDSDGGCLLERLARVVTPSAGTPRARLTRCASTW
jgi:hypothetical protein